MKVTVRSHTGRSGSAHQSWMCNECSHCHFQRICQRDGLLTHSLNSFGTLSRWEKVHTPRPIYTHLHDTTLFSSTHDSTLSCRLFEPRYLTPRRRCPDTRFYFQTPWQVKNRPTSLSSFYRISTTPASFLDPHCPPFQSCFSDSRFRSINQWLSALFSDFIGTVPS